MATKKKTTTAKKKAAPIMEAAEIATPDTPATPTSTASGVVKCTRPFRLDGRLYERGCIYADVPAGVRARFAHLSGDPKEDL